MVGKQLRTMRFDVQPRDGVKVTPTHNLQACIMVVLTIRQDGIGRRSLVGQGVEDELRDEFQPFAFPLPDTSVGASLASTRTTAGAVGGRRQSFVIGLLLLLREF